MMTTTDHKTWHYTRCVFRTTANAAQRTFTLPVSLLRFFQGPKKSDTFNPDANWLRKHLLVAMSSEKRPSQRVAAHDRITDLLSIDDWDSVFAQLRKWDTSRANTPEREDLIYLALKQIGEATLHEECGDVRLNRLEREHKARPESHLTAAALAMAHIAHGWKQRGADNVLDILPVDDVAYNRHFARAEGVLENFNAIERSSPALAIAQYHLYPWQPQADELLNEWFQDWIDLNPESVTPFMVHGTQFLPEWFGEDEEALEKHASLLSAETSEALGTGAYALMYLSAIRNGEYGGESLCSMDVPKFLKSLDDLVVRTPSQLFVNQVAHSLYRLVEMPMPANLTSAELEEKQECHKKIVLGYDQFVRRHLRKAYPSIWGGEDKARWHIAQAYRNELEDYAKVDITIGGAEITPHKQF